MAAGVVEIMEVTVNPSLINARALAAETREITASPKNLRVMTIQEVRTVSLLHSGELFD